MFDPLNPGRGGKAALAWQQLELHAWRVAKPIQCIACRRVLEARPVAGCPACGGRVYGVFADDGHDAALVVGQHGDAEFGCV